MNTQDNSECNNHFKTTLDRANEKIKMEIVQKALQIASQCVALRAIRSNIHTMPDTIHYQNLLHKFKSR